MDTDLHKYRMRVINSRIDFILHLMKHEDYCRSEIELRRKRWEEAHKQCVQRQAEYEELQRTLDDLDGELAKAHDERNAEVERFKGERVRDSQALVRQLANKIAEAREKAERMRGSNATG